MDQSSSTIVPNYSYVSCTFSGLLYLIRAQEKRAYSHEVISAITISIMPHHVKDIPVEVHHYKTDKAGIIRTIRTQWL